MPLPRFECELFICINALCATISILTGKSILLMRDVRWLIFIFGLLSYITHRLSKIRAARWQLGAVLPEKITKEILNVKEKEYFAKYASLLTEYNEDIGIDVTTDLEVWSCLPSNGFLIMH